MTASAPANNQIALLLGKPLVRESVLAEVVERLHRLTPTIILHHASKQGAIPELLFRSSLVVQRGLNLAQLDAATPLERAGVRCCNRIAATVASSNRAGLLDSLSAVGVRVPETSIVQTWPKVLEISRQRAPVVKRADGSVGRGQLVVIAVDGKLPAESPFRGPYAVQEYIPNNGTVQKLYVAGNQVRGLIKNALPERGSVDPGIPFDVDADLKALARRCSSALDLEIAGVDVLQADDGPCVIDVNPFPGFRHVPDGARLIAGHLASLVVDTNAG